MGIQQPTSYYKLVNRGLGLNAACNRRFDWAAVAPTKSALAEESLRRIRLTMCALMLLVPSLARTQEASPPKLAAEATPPNTVDALAKYQGMMVSKVEVQTRTSLHPDALQRLLIQKEGQPFDKEKVRQTLEALYESGRF